MSVLSRFDTVFDCFCAFFGWNGIGNPTDNLKKSFNLIHSVWNGLKWVIFGNEFSDFCQNLNKKIFIFHYTYTKNILILTFRITFSYFQLKKDLSWKIMDFKSKKNPIFQFVSLPYAFSGLMWMRPRLVTDHPEIESINFTFPKMKKRVGKDKKRVESAELIRDSNLFEYFRILLNWKQNKSMLK